MSFEFTFYSTERIEIPELLSERFSVRRGGMGFTLNDLSQPRELVRPTRGYVVWGDDFGGPFANLEIQEEPGYDYYPNPHDLESDSVWKLSFHPDVIKRLAGERRDGRRFFVADEEMFRAVEELGVSDVNDRELTRILGLLDRTKGQKTYSARFGTLDEVSLVYAASLAEVLQKTHGGFFWAPANRVVSDTLDLAGIEKRSYRPGDFSGMFTGGSD